MEADWNAKLRDLAEAQQSYASPLVRSDPALLVKRDPWDGSAFGLSGGLGARSPSDARPLGGAVSDAGRRPT